jgi:hypothetical protein
MKKATESLDHASVRQHCKAVRVPVIAANFLTLAIRHSGLRLVFNET